MSLSKISRSAASSKKAVPEAIASSGTAFVQLGFHLFKAIL